MNYVAKFLADAYYGSIPLWKAFFLCYLIPSFIVTFVATNAAQMSSDGSGVLVRFVSIAFVFGFYAFNAVVLWKNSVNTKYFIAKWIARVFSLFLSGLCVYFIYALVSS